MFDVTDSNEVRILFFSPGSRKTAKLFLRPKNLWFLRVMPWHKKWDGLNPMLRKFMGG